MRKTYASFRAYGLVLLTLLWLPVAELRAGGVDEKGPPIPKGYATPQQVKDAIKRGEVRLINLFPLTPESVQVTTSIEYGRVGERSLTLDLYEPKEKRGIVPGVILIHGGGWKSGDRKIYRAYCIRLAERGYVAATMSYRLSGEAAYPAAVQDAKCAVRWMRENASKYSIDPGKLAVFGASAGGHLSLMVGYTPDVPELEGSGGHKGVSSAVQAVVDFYGPTDLTVEKLRDADVVVKFFGGKKYDEAMEQYKQGSPLMHVKKGNPPTLILQGTIDDTVPVEQSDVLARRLKEKGIPCEYERLAGWPHTMDLAADVNARCWWRVEKFFDKYLPLPPTRKQNADAGH